MNKLQTEESTKFGTLGGVFTPCTLTILGVIMFLRFGNVVGQSGIFNAILILFLAKTITLLTTFSLSAIATNTKVKGGGAYFLISRSLGVEFGGAIGVVFFLAQAVSVAMYTIGFTEAFASSFPSLFEGKIFMFDPYLFVSTIVNILVFTCVFVGAAWTIKLQYGILAALCISLISFFCGCFPQLSMATFQENWGPSYISGENFFTMFALFFPAVTGIMAGANMSGDLRSPERSIPRGTLAAIVFTAFVYLVMGLFLAGAVPRQLLQENNLIVKDIAWSPVLVTVGIFSATLSSALGSMMGAPRILQAFARDDIFKSLKGFAQGSGASNEPRRATILTFFIAQGCILIGDLNMIAPIITMFFMITYGTLNLSTFYEGITKNPSYRPRFRLSHWSLSLLGTLGCLSVMFLISPISASVSILAMFALYQVIARRDIAARWGDVQRGVVFERARQNLLKLEEEEYHPKSWRPIILALSGGVWSRVTLSVYGHWLTAGHGLLTLCQIIVGGLENLVQRRSSQEKMIRKFIQENEISAFPAVAISNSLDEGITAMVQCHGIGGFRPNTVLVGWSDEENRQEAFGELLRILGQLQVSTIILKAEEEENPWQAPKGTIDIWWRGESNGALMLLLSYLLSKRDEWRVHKNGIRILRMIPSEAGKESALDHLTKLLESSRIEATPSVVVSENISEAIQKTSSQAALVFIGFTPPNEGEEQKFIDSMENLVGSLPRVFFVNSAGGMELE